MFSYNPTITSGIVGRYRTASGESSIISLEQQTCKQLALFLKRQLKLLSCGRRRLSCLRRFFKYSQNGKRVCFEKHLETVWTAQMKMSLWIFDSPKVSREILRAFFAGGVVVCGSWRQDWITVVLLNSRLPDYCSISISQLCKQSCPYINIRPLRNKTWKLGKVEYLYLSRIARAKFGNPYKRKCCHCTLGFGKLALRSREC